MRSTQPPVNRYRFQCITACKCATIRVTGAGHTLIELMIAVAIISTLLGLSAPIFSAYRTKATIGGAVEDLRAIHGEIIVFQVIYGRLPDDLTEAKLDHLKDPWGNPYH